MEEAQYSIRSWGGGLRGKAHSCTSLFGRQNKWGWKKKSTEKRSKQLIMSIVCVVGPLTRKASRIGPSVTR